MANNKAKKRVLGVAVRPPKVRVSVPVFTSTGGRRMAMKTITPRQSEQMRVDTQKELQDQYAGMCPPAVDKRMLMVVHLPSALSAESRRAFNELRDIADPTNSTPEDTWDDVGPADLNDLEDALNGEGLMESAGGGEFRDTLEQAIRREREQSAKKKKYVKFCFSLRGNALVGNALNSVFFRRSDHRKRRRRIARQANAFAGQMDALVDAYIEWGASVNSSLNKDVPVPDPKDVEKSYFIVVIDVFRAYDTISCSRRH